MKIISVAFSFLLLFQVSNAQIGSIIKGTAKNHVNNDVSNETEKTLDQVDPTKQKNKKNSDNSKKDSSSEESNSSSSQNGAAANTPPSVTAYQNYDFRAGDKIIFEDNFATDNDGEFPAHWDLTSGQAVVNKVTGVPSFLLTDGNYCRVKPLMKTDSYLTDNFSIEYDTYMTSGAYGLLVFMNDAEGNEMSVYVNESEVNWSYSNTKGLTGSLPESIAAEKYRNKWHHIAMAYKNDQLKVYVDQYRVLTVPHCGLKPANVSCAGIGNIEHPIIFKDFKVADGAQMNMLDAIMTDGKFVTHGINFDVNSANIKPESMGIIGDVAKYMKDHSDLKLEIDGHTDSDGSDDANMKLSQARSDAVKAAL
ncbi:MAG: OmpA family protein, partial [Chitinophagales bacterium]